MNYSFSKKFMKVAVAFALVTAPAISATPVFQPEQASAAAPTEQVIPLGQDTPGTGSIEVYVLNDDKKNRITEDLQLTIKDKSGTTVDSGTVTLGHFTPTKTTLAKGKYYVTISDGTVDQTTETTVSTRKVTLKLVWESKLDGLGQKNGKILKTGAVAGIVYNSTADTAAPVTGTKVTVVSGKTKWETTTKQNGKFKIFVPAGTYNVIVAGKDTNGDNKTNNISKKVKVYAGLTSLPLEQMNGSQDWTSEAAKKMDFDLDETSFTNISRKYTGKALTNSIVSVYEVTTTDTSQVETWIAETTAKKRKLDLTGTFSLIVPTAQPGRTLMFKVTDEAGNEYTEIQPSLAVYDPKLTPAAKTPLENKVVLKFTDQTKAYPKSITEITVYDGTKVQTLSVITKKNTTGDYSVSSSGITIAAKVFTKEGNYTIKVKAKGFVDQEVSQEIGQSITPVAELIATAEAGSTSDTTKVIVQEKDLASTSDTLVIKVSSLKIPTPTKGSLAPTTADTATGDTAATTGDLVTVNYTSGTDIFGVNSQRRYLGVYEVNSANEVVRFKLIPLTVIYIK